MTKRTFGKNSKQQLNSELTEQSVTVFPHNSNDSFSAIGFHDCLATAENGHLNNYLQTERFCEQFNISLLQ